MTTLRENVENVCPAIQIRVRDIKEKGWGKLGRLAHRFTPLIHHLGNRDRKNLCESEDSSV